VDPKSRLNHVGVQAVIATAEMITDGHPHHFCDHVAGAILAAARQENPTTRAGIECLVTDGSSVAARQMSTGVNVSEEVVTLISHIDVQSSDIARDEDTNPRGVKSGAAGDQGEMIGCATEETPDMLPQEYVPEKSLCRLLRVLRDSGKTPRLVMFFGIGIRNVFCRSYFAGVIIPW
jgi:S-adenosylmethionine synthetase